MIALLVLNWCPIYVSQRVTIYIDKMIGYLLFVPVKITLDIVTLLNGILLTNRYFSHSVQYCFILAIYMQLVLNFLVFFLLLIQWNLSKQNLLRTNVCVRNGQVFALYSLIYKLSYIVALFKVLFIQDVGLYRVQFIQDVGLYRVRFIQDVGLYRVQFIQDVGLYRISVYTEFGLYRVRFIQDVGL
jgi:hypothetical protein